MKNKYYMGYILNPEEVKKDDFDERTKIRCILISNGKEFRELLTDAKYYPVKENEVIDGKRIFETDASLVGTLEEEISIEKIVNIIYNNEIDKIKYINILLKLIFNTRKFAIQKEKEYLKLENVFKETFQAKRK